jgi:hypothetical protein
VLTMTLEDALAIIGGLSKASKMPCHTYALPAKNCHTGSKLHEVEGSVCSKCYALRGNFARPTIVASMERKLAAIDNPLWVEAMTLVILLTEFSGYFRWHSSGDVQSLGHLIKINTVAKNLPHIKFWLPTREVGILNSFVNAGFKFEPNLIVRLSAAMIGQRPPMSVLKSLAVVDSAVRKKLRKRDSNCVAPTQDNECRDCRKCWDKRVKVVNYHYH